MAKRRIEDFKIDNYAPKRMTVATKNLEEEGKRKYRLTYILESPTTIHTQNIDFKINNDEEACKKVLEILKRSAKHASKKAII